LISYNENNIIKQNNDSGLALEKLTLFETDLLNLNKNNDIKNNDIKNINENISKVYIYIDDEVKVLNNEI
jgi:hypothetical protein